MRSLLRRSSLLASTLLLLAVAVLPAFAFEPDPSVTSATSTGAVGVSETISSLMKRQQQFEARGGRKLRDAEAEIEQPDRSHLPQNPASPEATAMANGRAALQPSHIEQVESPQVVGTNFTGATLSGLNPTLSFPPDDMGAVGPTQYVVFVNGRLVTFNKTTGLADNVMNADPDVFFASVITSGSFTSDPRIRYDRLSGRWILAIIDVATPNRILLAVSDAASNGVLTGSTLWTMFFIPIASTPPTISSTCLADYPTLGVDANALYIGTNNFCGAGGNFNSCDGYVVRKSSVLGAGPIVVTVFRGLVPTASGLGPYTPQGVDNYDPVSNEGYFIGVDNLSFGMLQLRRVSNPGGTPTVSSNIAITVPTTTAPATVPHLGNTGGTSGNLDGLDDRLFAAHIRNGRLWTAHNIQVNVSGVASSSGGRDGSRWYELNGIRSSDNGGTPVVVQSGTIFDNAASNPTSYWIPSVMVSGQGHAAFGFSNSGAAARVNAGTVGRLAGTTAGTVGSPVLYTSATDAYNPPGDTGGGNGARRWGDYSYTSLDPLDDMTMWTVEQFCNINNSYGVRVAKLLAPPPATPATLADVTAGQNNVAVTLTGTAVSGSGFYDPGANLAGVPAFSHLAVSISNGAATGTPPSLVSATYVSPTSVNLVLNATAATANIAAEKYTITVTNPDGQTAAAAVLRVVGGGPTVSLAAGPSVLEGNAGPTAFGFTVNLSAAAVAPVTVRYQTSDGSATITDGDYLAANDSLIIGIGSSSGSFNVLVNGDTKFEANETFGVALTSALGATLGVPITATATIQNDDLPPTVSVDSLAINEGNVGTTTFGFTATLSAPSGVAASANFTTADGSATVAGNDYVATSGTINFAPGVATQPIIVTANGDLSTESDEMFVVTLTGLSGLGSVTHQGVGNILNDDDVPALAVDDVSGSEGSSGTTPFVFHVTLSHASGSTVTVTTQTADGSATLADNDYAAINHTLTFAPGVTAVNDTVRVTGNLCGEPNETFTLTLSSPAGATIATPTGTGTIQNDDDTSAPSATVLSPNGGVPLAVGSLATLQWIASDDVAVTGVDLLISRDGGASYSETIASGVANSGSYAWTVTGPTVVSVQALVKVVAHDAGCNSGSDVSDAGFDIVDAATAVSDGPVTEFALGGVRPNPTSGKTSIRYQLPREASVHLAILDVRGRTVSTLVKGSVPAGRHTVEWNGRIAEGPAPAGVYFVLFEAGGKHLREKLVLTH